MRRARAGNRVPAGRGRGGSQPPPRTRVGVRGDVTASGPSEKSDPNNEVIEETGPHLLSGTPPDEEQDISLSSGDRKQDTSSDNENNNNNPKISYRTIGRKRLVSYDIVSCIL